ncbi:hypothetical protein [Polycladomyces subterraneus]|uniref:DUF1499 domain-containing protein n=1 Tax=Polycladomyces subterraneus TaxID=1016997 RepID=A0ABT8IQ27_9BACL|nr:hypothetical protein [Polycladomyces subterraneus]MDN4594850.1 hypothetical protein [Polycladomyces subterraneus]
MSFLRRMFSGVTETGERDPDPELRTRYYRAPVKEVGETLEQLPARISSFRMVHHDRDRHEIMLEYRNPLGGKHDVVVTLFAVSPIRVAVDIHVATRGKMIDLGWNKKCVQAIYQHLDTIHPRVSGA